MTDKRSKTPESSQQTRPTESRPAPAGLDRRDFFRGAGLLTVGGLSATAGLAQPGTSSDSAARAGNPSPSEQLDAQTLRAQRWAGQAPRDWVRPRPDVNHNVVIVGGGQSGVAIANGLKRKGVGNVEVIDRADPGQAGIWRTVARMHQLRTPKVIPGPEQDNPMLSVRAWFETLHGPDAFDALDRIPRLAWADYVDWFQQVNGIDVRYRTRLLEIEPQGDLLRLHLEAEGVRRVETTRKVVLANGYAGAGGPNVPGFLRSLPADLWTHTASPVRFDALADKVVAIVGAGSSAFDAAAVALENGASEVHMFNRRPYVGYPGGQSAPPMDRGHPNVREMAHELPDAVRWRNFLRGERNVATVPTDSIERAVSFDNFRLHLDSSLAGVRTESGRVAARVGDDTWRFDHVIAGTGYRIDLATQPELSGIHETIARWQDRYQPEAGEGSAAGGIHPYLGAGFEFLPRDMAGTGYLRNIHCFNLSAALSFGKPVGDIPSTVDHPRLVAAITRDLYVESVDTEAHRLFISAPAAPANPAPYQRAIQPQGLDAA